MNTGQQTLNLFITYVDKEGPFLKVWGQAEKNNSLYVEQFLLGASQQFEQGIGKVPLEALQVGTIVCAKYKDTKYYRYLSVYILFLRIFANTILQAPATKYCINFLQGKDNQYWLQESSICWS